MKQNHQTVISGISYRRVSGNTAESRERLL